MEVDYISSSLGIEAMWLKVGLFILVQLLVYIILSQSSNVFSTTPRSHSFKTARSLSIRRWAAALADVPAGGDSSLSPSSSSPSPRLPAVDNSSAPSTSRRRD